MSAGARGSRHVGPGGRDAVVSERATVEAAVKLGLTPMSTRTSARSRAASRRTSSSPSTRSCGASTAATSTRKPILKRFPTSGPRILQGPGENAGIIDVGDGWAVAMKVESHNHPSAVEPFQGAATGVGGIVRDIFTMGARPCVSLDSLRFGEIEGDENARQRFLFDGVVGGIAFYGNCLGIPTVGGEVYFEESYAGNCLVNAMCAGVLRTDQIVRAIASGRRQPRRAHRLQDRPRRHRRRLGAGEPGVRRDASRRSAPRCRSATRSPRRS